jgi:hypothetical protein
VSFPRRDAGGPPAHIRTESCRERQPSRNPRAERFASSSGEVQDRDLSQRVPGLGTRVPPTLSEEMSDHTVRLSLFSECVATGKN